MEVLGPVTYTVEADKGMQWKCHANQLKDRLLSRLLLLEVNLKMHTELLMTSFQLNHLLTQRRLILLQLQSL